MRVIWVSEVGNDRRGTSRPPSARDVLRRRNRVMPPCLKWTSGGAAGGRGGRPREKEGEDEGDTNMGREGRKDGGGEKGKSEGLCEGETGGNYTTEFMIHNGNACNGNNTATKAKVQQQFTSQQQQYYY